MKVLVVGYFGFVAASIENIHHISNEYTNDTRAQIVKRTTKNSMEMLEIDYFHPKLDEMVSDVPVIDYIHDDIIGEGVGIADLSIRHREMFEERKLDLFKRLSDFPGSKFEELVVDGDYDAVYCNDSSYLMLVSAYTCNHDVYRHLFN